VTFTPSFSAYGAYSQASSPPESGLMSEGFNAGFDKLRRQSGKLKGFEVTNINTGFFMLCMEVLCLVFLECSLRTDIAHVIVFLSSAVTFGLPVGHHFQLAENNVDLAGQLQVVRFP